MLTTFFRFTKWVFVFQNRFLVPKWSPMLVAREPNVMDLLPCRPVQKWPGASLTWTAQNSMDNRYLWTG